MAKYCTSCLGLTWCDGEFWCKTNMKLIEPSKDGKWSAKIPDAFNAENCADYDFSTVAQSIYESDYLVFLAECEAIDSM